MHCRINGAAHLATINTATGAVSVHPTPFTTITNLVRRWLVVRYGLLLLLLLLPLLLRGHEVPGRPMCRGHPIAHAILLVGKPPCQNSLSSYAVGTLSRRRALEKGELLGALRVGSGSCYRSQEPCGTSLCNGCLISHVRKQLWRQVRGQALHFLCLLDSKTDVLCWTRVVHRAGC